MLYDKLKSNNRIPFHMPGHKRNINILGIEFPYDIDITEIDGFDNLHNPTGIIKDIEKRLSNLYQSNKSFMLVNGSTCGVISAVTAVVEQGDTVLMARNCHKSVYNAVEIAKANAQYIYPDLDEYGISKSISPKTLEQKLSVNSDIKLIVITSPTYEGVISDLKEICHIAHRYNIPVLVDAAHGAHLLDRLEEFKCADIVVMSLHKTLPALTQTAVLNTYSNLIDYEEIRNRLSYFETSSPSYVLMSSVEKCLDFIENNRQLIDGYCFELQALHNSLSLLSNLESVKYDDLSKIIIYTGNTNITGLRLSELLREDYNIEIEMAGKDYIIAMTSICDDFSNYDLLVNALFEIDKTLIHTNSIPDNKIPTPTKKLNSCEIGKSKKLINLDEAANLISAEYVFAYPPGIPVLVPGELIDNQVIDYITENIASGVNILSTYGVLPEKIYVKKV